MPAMPDPSASPPNAGPVTVDDHPAGFHDGELEVQLRAGVTADAARLSGMLDPADLSDGVGRQLADRTFAALTGTDRHGRLWTSPLTGQPGFLDPTGSTTLTIHAAPVAGDPLHGLPAGQPVGLVVVDFPTRRRVRVNGTLIAAEADTLHLTVEQAYGNCPQYIQRRVLQLKPSADRNGGAAERRDRLTADDVRVVRAADTFFIGTYHPTRGTDASHRGGPAGFVRVASGRLWWPDYSGNNMFNTLGNLAVDPRAALLFTDFATGHTLQLSGTAAVEWTPPAIPGDDDGTGRRVHVTPQSVVAGQFMPLHAADSTVYPRNPPLTGATAQP